MSNAVEHHAPITPHEADLVFQDINAGHAGKAKDAAEKAGACLFADLVDILNATARYKSFREQINPLESGKQEHALMWLRTSYGAGREEKVTGIITDKCQE